MSSPPNPPDSPEESGGTRRLGPILVRAGVSLGLLAALLVWLPRDELFGAISRTPPALWLGVLVAFLAGHVVTALKWRMLVAASGAPTPAGSALRAHAAGLFANLCLPSIVGGDVVRAGMVMGSRDRAAAVAVGSLGDRVLDTLALTALAALAVLLLPDSVGGWAPRILGAAAVVCFAAALGAVIAVRSIPPERLPERLAPLRGPWAKVREALTAHARRPAPALLAWVLSLVVQLAFVGLNAALGRAVGIDLPLAVWLLAWPLAKLAALLPVSLGGIGVREVALAALLAPFGVAGALAVAQSLLWETILVAAGLLAGAGSLLLGARPRAVLGEETS